MATKYVGTDKIIEINTPEKAYTFGFIWGDGTLNHRKNTNIYSPTIEIKSSDFEKIYPIFSSLGKGSVHHRHRANRQPQSTMTICDKDLGWFLFKNDYLIKSQSEPTKILSLINEAMKQYWWRGFIDADGCFYVHKKQYLKQFSLAGSFENTWIETEKLFQQLEIDKFEKQYKDYRPKKNSRSSVIRMSNKSNIVKLGNYLYQDRLDIGLKRKYDTFMRIKQE